MKDVFGTEVFWYSAEADCLHIDPADNEFQQINKQTRDKSRNHYTHIDKPNYPAYIASFLRLSRIGMNLSCVKAQPAYLLVYSCEERWKAYETTT